MTTTNNNDDRAWALITGSSVGIGREIAIELSKRGYNIVIHGRNKKELIETSKKLGSDFIIVDSDLSAQDGVLTLLEEIQSFNIKVLVNNAGFSVAGNYESTPLEKELEMIHLQINTPMQLIKALIPKLKGDGYILNVASLYSYFAVPKQSIYGASKSFLQSFSLALRHELKSEGISVSTLSPGLTYSTFRTRHGKKEKHYPLIGLSSNYVAKQGVNELFKEKAVIIPGLFAKLMAFIIPLLPYSIQLYFIDKMNSSRGY